MVDCNSNNQLNSQLNNQLNKQLNNKLQSMLAFPSLVNETLKYFSGSSPSSMANALTSQMIGQFGSSNAEGQTSLAVGLSGLGEDNQMSITGILQLSSKVSKFST